MIKRMESMKEQLMNCVQSQLGDLASVDAEELGEVVDMIKDFSEAIYYCTITEAMEENSKKEKEHPKYYTTPMYYPPMDYNMYYTPRDMDRDYGRMYYDDRQNNAGGDRRNYPMTYASNGSGSGSMNGSNSSSRNYPVELRDYREGNSPMARKNYMEHKEMHHGKEVKMQELEKYMHELTNDITEMISDASPEEKQLLQKKISALATKIV